MAINIARRKFIAALGGIAFAWPLAARAQQLAGRTARIGFVGPSLDNPVVSLGYPAFLDELKKFGFSEGQNLAIENVGQTIPKDFSPKRLIWCGRTWNCWSP